VPPPLAGGRNSRKTPFLTSFHFLPMFKHMNGILTLTKKEPKMEITLIKLSGNVEELEKLTPKVAEWFGDASAIINVSIKTYTTTDKPPHVDDDLMQRMLTRHPPIELNHKGFLGVLYRATDWVSANTICREMGITPKRLTGVMGSFGRRCAGTPDWPKVEKPSRLLISYERRVDDHYYCLTPDFRRVITDTKVL